MKKKICKGCKEAKDISYFDRNKKMRDGYLNFCRPCIRVLHKPSPKNFNEVASLVKSGLTIQNALKKLKIDHSYFYKGMTDEQKIELKNIKISTSVAGISGRTGTRLLMNLNHEEDENLIF